MDEKEFEKLINGDYITPTEKNTNDTENTNSLQLKRY